MPAPPPIPGEPPAGPRPQPPQPIRTAVILMYVGAGLALLQLIIGLGSRDSIRDRPG